MNLLKHIWPWSELDRLRKKCNEHWQFGEACIFLLNQVDPLAVHVRLAGRLYSIGRENSWVVGSTTPVNVGCVPPGTETKI